jgi:hypothetical protein
MQPTESFRPIVLAIALACTLGVTPSIADNGVTPPPTPAAITPPSGNTPFLMGHAVGTQGYVCLPTASGASWTVNASRPQATLFITIGPFTQQILTHFLSPDTNPNSVAPSPLPLGSPTWQSSFDSSLVWGNKVGSIAADPSQSSCPASGAIPCLLLQAIGSQNGPAGGSFMTVTTYIQRLNTTGGSAPATGCSVSANVGSQVLVPYTADYYFYKAGQ